MSINKHTPQTHDDLGLTFDSVAIILGYNLNNIDEFAKQAIENELHERQRQAEWQSKLRKIANRHGNFRFDGWV